MKKAKKEAEKEKEAEKKRQNEAQERRGRFMGWLRGENKGIKHTLQLPQCAATTHS